MATAMGDSPEESPEVPEPDLSMELQDQIRRRLTEHELRSQKEESHTLCLQLPPATERYKVDCIRELFGHAALVEIVGLLKSFDPDISQDKLSSDVHSIVHCDAIWQLHPAYSTEGLGDTNMHLKAVLQRSVPRSRSLWLGDDIEKHMSATQGCLRAVEKKIRQACQEFARHLPDARAHSDPSMVAKLGVLSASSLSMLMAIHGGGLGLLCGLSAGLIVGTVPAPLTAGFSIPAGSIAGGGIGVCIGTWMGSTIGFVSGGVLGPAMYVYREELKEASMGATHRTIAFLATGKRQMVLVKLETLKALAEMKATDAAKAAQEILTSDAIQVSLASATGGAILTSIGGGAIGFSAGGTVGAACGIAPALVTLGFSIPFFAAIGSFAGLCIGAATGGTAGFVGGGSVGYSVYQCQDDIKSRVAITRGKASDIARVMKDTAQSSVVYVRKRLVGDRGGTN